MDAQARLNLGYSHMQNMEVLRQTIRPVIVQCICLMNNWIFLGGHCKTGLFLEVISEHSRAFS